MKTEIFYDPRSNEIIWYENNPCRCHPNDYLRSRGKLDGGLSFLSFSFYNRRHFNRHIRSLGLVKIGEFL
jgi:hypothetical protein